MRIRLLVPLLIACAAVLCAPARGDHASSLPEVGRTSGRLVSQTPSLAFDEALTVYLGNLARRANGRAPLRWNQQLTDAARWFSWDSTENRAAGFCGHQDTQGNWPDDRALSFGYLGSAGAENAYCGYVTPDEAIQGWMNSTGHRANLLNPDTREIGLGYYRRTGDGRGYVAQDFGNDPVYAPVIIANEAITTASANVALYIYDRSATGGFAGLSQATQAVISNDACFTGAAWVPYATDKAWTLTGGQGWRSVYVKTRDAFSRTLAVSDTIYLGPEAPPGEIGAAQMSTTQPQVTLHGLSAGALPLAQLSLGWLADDTFETFDDLWGHGERVSDAAAWGGTAYRLAAGEGEASAWVWDSTFIKDTPMTAYVRLKVSSNTSTSEVARFSISGGGVQYGPLSLRGTDFAAPDQYQEFALNFTFNSNPNDVFLIFQFWRSGGAAVDVDAVSIFTRGQTATSPLTWAVPGGNYRGQGVWVRYTDGSRFSAIAEAATTQPALNVSPAGLSFRAVRGGSSPPATTLSVLEQCGSFAWQVSDNAAWLQAQATGNSVVVTANQAGLARGVYTGSLTIAAVGGRGVAPVAVPVRLTVVDAVRTVNLPLIMN